MGGSSPARLESIQRNPIRRPHPTERSTYETRRTGVCELGYTSKTVSASVTQHTEWFDGLAS